MVGNWGNRLAITLLIVCVMLSGSGCGKVSALIDDLIFESYIEMYASPLDCDKLFGCTPEEFFDMDFEAYGLPKDFSKHSKILEDGYLYLLVDEDQQHAWRNSSLLTDYSDFPRVEVSADKKQVIVYAYAETVNDDAIGSTYVLTKLFAIHVVDGISPEDVKIEYIIKDAVTHEIFFEGVWPHGFDSIDFSKYNFSSLYEN